MKEKETTTEEQERSITLNDFLQACLSKTVWFVVSVVLICALAAFYVMRQQPRYLRTEQVLIKDQDSGSGIDAVASAFSSMGLGSSNTNVYNELITLQSPALITQVVLRLNLTDNYLLKDFPHPVTLYRSTLPYLVAFPNLDPEKPVGFKMTIDPEAQNVRIYKMWSMEAGKKVKYHQEYELPISVLNGGKVKTPVGMMTINPNPEYAGEALTEPATITMFHNSLHGAVEHYTKQLKADLTDRDAQVIDLSVKDVNVQRAEDFLRTIVEVYNQDWIDDNNKMAIATSNFIDERLKLIEQELGDVDSDITQFKSQTLVPDLETAVKINMQSGAELTQEMLKNSNELSMARYVKEYVVNPAHAKDVIPVNTGTGNPSLEGQIANYNNLLLLRNNLANGSSDTNPLVRDYDAQLKGMREAIVQGINTQIGTLEKVERNLQHAQGNLKGDLASGPKQAKYLLSIERQQKVKESLYLYLLQKREENELSQTFTANNTRIITPPYGPAAPVSPKTKLIMCLAFIISLLIPGGLIYLQEAHNTKVRSRRDLEKMSTPFAGEIPFAGPKVKFAKIKKIFRSKKGKKRELETLPVQVQAGSRDILNESFRIVRSNIDYMLQHDDASNVMMVTSLNAGSGKSFITANLAASFAIKGKRVLIIDCDLRHGSSSQFVGMPSSGLSQYLSGATDEWRPQLVHSKEVKGLDVLPIGHRPPNPAELLENGRIGTLLKEADKEYDYVLLDCPPLDVVVDTQIIEKYVGTTVFVIRAGLLEQSAVTEIDGFYKNHRFRRMCILLNGTEGKNSHLGAYGSSYYSSDFN